MRSLWVTAGIVVGTLLATPAVAHAATGATARTWDVPLNVRVSPISNAAKVSSIPNGGALSVECQVKGQWVNGFVRSTDKWDLLTTGGYVSDAYVARAVALPKCGAATQPAQAAQAAAAAAPTAAPAPGGFIGMALAPAQHSRATYRVPISVTIAQAILESGWGSSELAKVENSIFGIKCFGWSDPIAKKCVDYKTWECEGSKCYKTTAKFRSYATVADSFLDHGRFLTVNSRYAGAFAHVNSPDEFARAIARAGYATDPNYANKLLKIMKTYNLYQYDR